MEHRSPILPPPPSASIVIWAALNALWYRVAGAVLRAVQRTRRLVEVFEPVTSPRLAACDGRLSSLIARLERAERADRAERLSATLRDPPRQEQPTLVDVKRFH